MLTLHQKLCIIVYVGLRNAVIITAKAQDKKVTILIRLLGQAVKTPPFHGGIRGSIPLGVTIMWEHSSAGIASALQAEGHRFDPCCSHHIWPSGSVG